MTDKIGELTEKIYNEGIVKAKADANQIITEAKQKADEIIKSAKKQESEILEKANAEAVEIKKNTNAEMQLAARQFTSNLKQQITNFITTEQVSPPVNEAFNDSNFIKNIIRTIIDNWNPKNPEELDLKVILPEESKKEFIEFFEERAIETLNKGVELEFDSKTKKGFKIGPKDGSYIISFSDKDFENYFKGYFKERTKKLLFDQ